MSPRSGLGSILASRLLFAALCAGCACARADIEILPLRHRTAEQVAPVLQPLLEPGGALSAAQNQIVVRASAANIAQLRQVLASIDRPLRRLLISVRQDASGGESAAGGSASASPRSRDFTAGTGPGRESGVSARVFNSVATREDRVDQQVQVLEGATAVLQVGESAPVTSRTVGRGPGGVIISQSTTFRDTQTGFAVIPRLAGDRVYLDIAPRREVPGPGGSANVQRISTAASGRLGEWFELGAIESSESVRAQGLLSSRSALGASALRVWVKVEELP